MSKPFSDGNIIGRLGAIALIVAAGLGLHRLSCSGGMCPVMQTDSCCSGVAHAKAEMPKVLPAPVPENPAK